MTGGEMNTEEFLYKGAVYTKDISGLIKFKGYGGTDTNGGHVSLSDAVFDRDVKGTPLWDLIFNPDYDVTLIRPCGSVIKIKNYFIKENDDCVFLLHGERVCVKITVTNGEISEYESLPVNVSGKERDTAIAWLCKRNQNTALCHTRCAEGDIIC